MKIVAFLSKAGIRFKCLRKEKSSYAECKEHESYKEMEFGEIDELISQAQNVRRELIGEHLREYVAKRFKGRINIPALSGAVRMTRHGKYDKRIVVFTAAKFEDRNVLGIVTLGDYQYTATGASIKTDDFSEAMSLVDEINNVVFGLSTQFSSLIQKRALDVMRARKKSKQKRNQ